MRTTLDIDKELLEKVVDVTGEGSKSKAVNKALSAYVREVRMKRLLELQGKLDLDLDDWYEFRLAARLWPLYSRRLSGYSTFVWRLQQQRSKCDAYWHLARSSCWA